MCKLLVLIHRHERIGRPICKICTYGMPICTIFIFLVTICSMLVEAVEGLVLVELLTSGNETLVRGALTAGPVPQLPYFFAL